MLPNTKIRLHGDFGLAGRYVGVCKSRLARLNERRIDTQLPFQLERVRFSDVVTATLFCGDDGHYIDIRAGGGACSIWMDSGLVNVGVGAISPSHPNALDPSPLYLDSDFGTYPRGRITEDGDAALGWVSSGEANNNGEATLAFTIPPDPETGTTPNDLVLTQKKNFAASVPASMFSGLMRVFVQALYGHKFNDDDVARYSAIGAGQPSLNLLGSESDPGTFNVANTETSTAGIYLDSGYTPWFVQIIASGGTWRVRIREAVLTACGIDVRATLRTDYPNVAATKFNTDRNVLVAVMLSQAWPKFSGYDHTFDTGVTTGGGIPLAYGWSFNKNGDTAEIVTHVGASSGGNSCWSASRFKINLVRDPDKDVSQYTTDDAKETARWTTVTCDIVFTGHLWNLKFGAEYIWKPNWDGRLTLTNYYPPLTAQLGTYAETVIHVMYQPTSDTPFEIKTQKTTSGGSTVGESFSESCWSAGDPGHQVYPSESQNGSKIAYTSKIDTVVTVGGQIYDLEVSGGTRDIWSIVGSVDGITPPAGAPVFDNLTDTTIFNEDLPFTSNLTPPCYGPDNGAYTSARAGYNSYLASSPCQFSEIGGFSPTNAAFYRTENKTAELTTQHDASYVNTQKIALIFPTYDCSSVYVFTNLSDSATRTSDVSRLGYPALRWYAFSYWNNIPPCTFNHYDYWYKQETNARPSTDVFANVSHTVVAYGTTSESAECFLGDTLSISMPSEVMDANKANLLSPSTASPYHNTPFFTRTAALMGGKVGEGIFAGGYTVPDADSISRFFLTFVGFA